MKKSIVLIPLPSLIKNSSLSVSIVNIAGDFFVLFFE